MKLKREIKYFSHYLFKKKTQFCQYKIQKYAMKMTKFALALLSKGIDRHKKRPMPASVIQIYNAF